MATDTAQAVLESFGRQVGIEGLGFDEGGHCALAIDDKTVVNIEHDVPRERLLLYSLIGAPGGDLAAAYGAILRANYLGVETRGPTFGLRPDDDALVLSQYLPLVTLDLPTFEAALQNFVGVTEDWSARLPGLGAPASEPAPSPLGSLRA
jgi:hypothetical protein